MIGRLRIIGVASAILFAALLFAAPVRAVTALHWVSASPDVTVELDTATVDDEDVALKYLAGLVVPENLGNLPGSTDVTAYHLLWFGEGGGRLVSFDTTVALPGGLTADRGDVVRYDGVNYSLEFDASAEGVPGGAVTDAVSLIQGGDLLLSFDTTVDLGAITATDEDLVRFNGVIFTSFFDGSSEGVAEALDLDAAHHLDHNGHLVLSFDGSGTLGGVDFEDEDLLEFDPGTSSWELAFDGSTQHAGWSTADLDAVAVPEPGVLLGLVSCVALLLAIGRQRSVIAARCRSKASRA